MLPAKYRKIYIFCDQFRYISAQLSISARQVSGECSNLRTLRPLDFATSAFGGSIDQLPKLGREGMCIYAVLPHQSDWNLHLFNTLPRSAPNHQRAKHGRYQFQEITCHCRSTHDEYFHPSIYQGNCEFRYTPENKASKIHVISYQLRNTRDPCRPDGD